MSEQNSLERVSAGPPDNPGTISIPAYTVDQEEGKPLLLREYWRVLRKYRATVSSILMLVIVTVLLGTMRQRPVYLATTVLQIDKENPNILSFKDSFEMDTSSDDYLETAYNVLQSEALVIQVIDKLHLNQVQEFYKPRPFYKRVWRSNWMKSPVKPGQISAEEGRFDPAYENAIGNFLDRLTVDPVRRSRLVRVGFRSNDPVLAARVVNTLASAYIERNLETKWDSAQKASDWLSKQLVSLKAKLEKSEEELQRYANDKSILFLDEKQSLTGQKLKELQEEDTKAESDLAQKESLYNQVKGGDLSSVPGTQDNKLYQDLSGKLAELRREYAELSVTFTSDYPRVRRLKSQIDEIEKTLEKERGSFARRIGDEYRAAVNRKRLLDDSVARQTKQFKEIADYSIRYGILKREADTNRQLYEGLLTRVKEAGVAAGIRASNIQVVVKGRVPLEPDTPRPMLNLALGFVIGLSLGVGAAFLQEHLDNTLKTPEDVQQHLQLCTLGMIPAASGRGKLPYGYSARKALTTGPGTKDGGGHPELIAVDNNTALSEAYRSLRTSVLLSTSGRPPRTILVTSGQAGEGKTTTTVNLGIALAQLGERVIIVDSDMRRPRVASLLKIAPSSAGLSTFLTGQFSVDDVVAETSIANLYAIPCGPLPPNPAELMSSQPMRELLKELQSRFDYVLLDSPPVLLVTDARILATQVEAAILVAKGSSTPRELVSQAKAHLLRVNANVIGVVLNDLDFSGAAYDYHYHYYRGYSSYGYESQEAQENAPADI